jgi:hypothetical protein
MSSLAADITASRKHEMRSYLGSIRAVYDTALLQNAEIYDIAVDLTKDFRSITDAAILADSRIIKVLRYAVAPSISQMKLGQLFDKKSVKAYEENKLVAGTSTYRELSGIAVKLATFAAGNLDAKRFPWAAGKKVGAPALAKEYAKNWTCSLAADQNAQTKYRNWRKNQQEQAIANALVALGYIKSSYAGVISAATDLNLGEFTSERKVKGRTVQKADFAVRSKKTGKLVLVEAKAVGVELDATKRIKECCDKSGDWRGARPLAAPDVVAVVAGFFNHTVIGNLKASKVTVVWEHRLGDLDAVL